MMIFSRMFNFMNSRMDEFIEEQKDIKLILDEQLLLQDLVMPQQQYKLLNYIKDNPQHLETLIEYITDINEEDYSIRSQYKYPFLSSEILSKENDFFQDFLFEESNHHYLNRLFSILYEDTLNITQAGYFSKIILTLLRKKHSKVSNFLKQVLAYINQKDISNLLKHLDVSHIADIVERMVVSDPNSESEELEKQKEILQRVMKIALHRYYETDIFDNCMQIINSLIKNSHNAINTELIDLVYNPQFFLTICYQSPRTLAYDLVSNMLQYINITGKVQLYTNFIEVAKQLPSAIKTINLFATPHETTYGQLVVPLSQNKLILLQIYYLLLLSENDEIIQEFIQNQSFQTITQLILSHQFNNQALIWYEKIVTFIQQKLPQFYLSIEIFLANTIIQYNTNQKQQTGVLKNFVNPGYQGILTKISNILVECQYNSPEWEKYENETLKKINEVEKRFLCDVDPKQRQAQICEPITQTIALSYTPQEQQQDVAEEDLNEDDNNKENENEYPQDYDDEDEKDKEEKFYDCNEEGLQQQLEEQQKQEKEAEEQPVNKYELILIRHKYSAEEQESIEEQIEEIISDPQTSVEEVAQIIQTEEKLAENEELGALEKKQDHQVNEYFKAHEENSEE